jgi:hypothetical protein
MICFTSCDNRNLAKAIVDDYTENKFGILRNCDDSQREKVHQYALDVVAVVSSCAFCLSISCAHLAAQDITCCIALHAMQEWKQARLVYIKEAQKMGRKLHEGPSSA